MPLLANWPLEIVEQELGRAGIHLLEKFPDGQTRWGTEPLRDNPYSGSFTMASEYRDGRYDIFQVKAIMHRLDKTPEEIESVSEKLYRRINEGIA